MLSMCPLGARSCLLCPPMSLPRVDTGWNGPLCDSGARRLERKVLVRRTDPGRPDDGGEREGCHEHREVFTDARTWPGGERDELPAVAVPGVLQAEPIGVKDQRALPQGRIPVQGNNPHGHD